MALPEYGRAVQSMVDHALTIEDRQERQRCANTIIQIMRNMFPPQEKGNDADYYHRLWDHLAIMSDFKLDVDYPFEMTAKERWAAMPDYVRYPQGKILVRHYGRLVQELIKKACELPDGPLKMNLVAMICNQMKKDYITWNKDNIDNYKIDQDLVELSGGKLYLTPELEQLMDRRVARVYRPSRGQSQKGAPGNRNKKRY